MLQIAGTAMPSKMPVVVSTQGGRVAPCYQARSAEAFHAALAR